VAVDPDAGVSEDAVEIELDALAFVFFGKGESLAVPADAGFWIDTTHWFVAVAHVVAIATF